MKIFTAQQIRKWEAITIQNNSVSVLQLMQTASESCVRWLIDRFDSNSSFSVFCGGGNNGGDGFTIAKMLYEKGFDVHVFCDQKTDFSPAAFMSFNRCGEISGIDIHDFEDVDNFNFNKNTVIIEALFGIVFHGKVEGKIACLIRAMNELAFPKVSIDLPAGLSADEMTMENAVVFETDETLTFQSWKKTFLHPETGVFCGRIHVCDIGLSPEFYTQEYSNEFVIDEQFILTIFKKRNPFSHKGTFGKTTIAAGSFGKTGAAVLATKAALKSGSGLTYILAPKSSYEILQMTCPEAIFVHGGENKIVNFHGEEDTVFGIGPGIGMNPETEHIFLEFLKKYNRPLVLDADALHIIAKHSAYLKYIPADSIITPHPKEFERLFGKTENSFERLNLARQKAQELNIFIVLKDHHTQVITPDNQVFYNITGNSGMAKGGSGDVLLGIIASLLAQKYSSQNAAIFGVWLHGKAGDFAAEKYSKEAMLASDLIEELGTVFRDINEKIPSV